MKPRRVTTIGDRVELRDIALAAGTTPQAVRRWIDRNHPNTRRKYRGRNVAPATIAEKYLTHETKPRTPRPRDWINIKQVLMDEAPSRQYLENRIKTGELRARKHRNTIYLHPTDLQHTLLQHKSYRPLPGWIPITTVMHQANRSKEAVTQWARRNNIQRKKFIPNIPNHTGRPEYHIRQKDAQTYLSLTRRNGDKHTRKDTLRPGLTTRQRMYRTLRRTKHPLTTRELAEAVGIKPDTAHHHLTILKRSGRITTTGKHRNTKYTAP